MKSISHLKINTHDGIMKVKVQKQNLTKHVIVVQTRKI